MFLNMLLSVNLSLLKLTLDWFDSEAGDSRKKDLLNCREK